MNSYRTNATIAGVLYIIGTVAGIASLALSQPLRDAGDVFAGAVANANQVIVAALCVLLMGLSLAMVSVVLYPVLRRHSEVLALGYVVFRGAIETLSALLTPTAWLVLLALGRSYRAGRRRGVWLSGRGRAAAEGRGERLTPWDRLLLGRPDVLHSVVPVTPGASLDIRVGAGGSGSVPGCALPRDLRRP